MALITDNAQTPAMIGAALQPQRSCPSDLEYAAVLKDALSREGGFSWRLRGASMTPTLPPGCEIAVYPFVQPPRLGDIVVFSWQGRLLAHRLVRKQDNRWIAQGDARLRPDPPISERLLIGRITEARLGKRVIWTQQQSVAARQRWVIRHHLLRLGPLPYRLKREIKRLWIALST